MSFTRWVVWASVCVALAQDDPYCSARYDRLCQGKGPHVGCQYPNRGAGPACENYTAILFTNDLKQFVIHYVNRRRQRIASGHERVRGGVHLPKPEVMMLVHWDRELAYLAQRLADQCQFIHDDCRATVRYPYAGQTVGEVRWRRSGKALERGARRTIGRVFDAWWGERRRVHVQQLLSPFSLTAKGAVWGHFSQLAVWTLRAMGCGAVHHGSSTPRLLLVCDFSHTNMLGQRTISPGPLAPCPPHTMRAERPYPLLCAPPSVHSRQVMKKKDGYDEEEEREKIDYEDDEPDEEEVEARQITTTELFEDPYTSGSRPNRPIRPKQEKTDSENQADRQQYRTMSKHNQDTRQDQETLDADDEPTRQQYRKMNTYQPVRQDYRTLGTDNQYPKQYTTKCADCHSRHQYKTLDTERRNRPVQDIAPEYKVRPIQDVRPTQHERRIGQDDDDNEYRYAKVVPNLLDAYRPRPVEAETNRDRPERMKLHFKDKHVRPVRPDFIDKDRPVRPDSMDTDYRKPKTDFTDKDNRPVRPDRIEKNNRPARPRNLEANRDEHLVPPINDDVDPDRQVKPLQEDDVGEEKNLEMTTLKQRFLVSVNYRNHQTNLYRKKLDFELNSGNREFHFNEATRNSESDFNPAYRPEIHRNRELKRKGEHKAYNGYSREEVERDRRTTDIERLQWRDSIDDDKDTTTVAPLKKQPYQQPQPPTTTITVYKPTSLSSTQTEMMFRQRWQTKPRPRRPGANALIQHEQISNPPITDKAKNSQKKSLVLDEDDEEQLYHDTGFKMGAKNR